MYRLVYFESFRDVQDALRAEKVLKGWTRERKRALIEARNPRWRDLASVAAGEEAAPVDLGTSAVTAPERHSSA